MGGQRGLLTLGDDDAQFRARLGKCSPSFDRFCIMKESPARDKTCVTIHERRAHLKKGAAHSGSREAKRKLNFFLHRSSSFPHHAEVGNGGDRPASRLAPPDKNG